MEKAVQKVLAEDKKSSSTRTRGSVQEREDEIVRMIDKIRKLKSQLSEEAVAKPELMQELDETELKLRKCKISAGTRDNVQEKEDEIIRMIDKIRKLKSQFSEEAVAKPELMQLMQELDETELKLKCKISAGSRDSVQEKEDEIIRMIDKIHKQKMQLSEEEAVAKPELMQDLEETELKLNRLKLQIKPRCSEKSEHRLKGSASEVYTYKRFQTKETQTDSSLDAFWQISARESSVTDQIWFLYERKTAMDSKEASLKKKEEELKLREEALIAGKVNHALNLHVDNVSMNAGTNGVSLPYSHAQARYRSQEQQLGSSVPSRMDEKSRKVYRHTNNSHNKYKYKSNDYIINNGGGSKGRP